MADNLNDGRTESLTGTNRCSNGETFVPVENPAVLETILKSRLPASTNIYNTVKMSKKWGNLLNCFAYGLGNPKDAWIVVKYQRPDFGQEITISRPLDRPISPEMRKVLKTAPFINWDEDYCIAAIDLEISSLMMDISVRDRGNAIRAHPGYLYYMDIQDALALSPTVNTTDGAQIGPLTLDAGTEFLMGTWKYANNKSPEYIQNCLKLNPSGGISIGGKIVSGAACVSHGLIGMLYTLPEARGKGYARSTMHFIMKSVAEDGMIPACTVETKNEASNTFQCKIGFKRGPEITFLVYQHTDFD